MKGFLIKVILFSLCLFATDRLFLLLRYKDTNVFSEIAFSKMKTLSRHLAANKVETIDIGIFGSSHPQFGLSPEIISKVTGKSCINFAYGGGTNIGAQYELIKRLQLKPKVIVFAIDVFSLNYAAVKGDPFQDTLFNNHSIFAANVDNPLNYSYIYLYSHFLSRYKSDFKRGNFTPPYFRENDSIDLTMFSQYYGFEISPTGWVRGNGHLNKNFLRYSSFEFKPNRESIQALERIVAYCKAGNIRLVLIQMPEHAVALAYSQKYKDFDKWIRNFTSENDLIYLDFDNQNAFPVDNDSLFFDTDHLNIKGALLFSDMLAKQLKDSISF
jgi:hypothetical protein